MPRRKKSSVEHSSDSQHKSEKRTVKPEDIKHLHAMLAEDDEQDIEKEIKQVLRDRRQKLHRQAAAMESRNKRLLMWVSVVMVMLVILSLWIVKFNDIVGRPVLTVKQEVQDIDFDKARDELTNTMKKVRQGIDDIKAQAQQLEQEKTQEEGANTAETIEENQVSQ